MRTLHLVSHTHWDREWYLTFQQFRLKLVHLVDGLLDILAADPQYGYFMLDGQTIVLEDYLEVRPEREAELRRHIQSGRLLIGPWYMLPDEFLVSPEATIRNLLEGERVARRFGPKMMVGYIPDPFGHIGQMPQILRGFDIDAACVWRGLDDQPCELQWQAPDGSQVLLAYLRESYSNAAGILNGDIQAFAGQACLLRDTLVDHAAAMHILLMQGTDHMEPNPNTGAALASAEGSLDGDSIIHSTLPGYLNALRESLDVEKLPVVHGELRSAKHSPLLPGVLSTRMWIKQRNQSCETLLERWAEPFCSFASWVDDTGSLPTRVRQPEALLHYAWRLLMQCHPHDSICGCSIDQVHEEMRARFDQVEQLGEQLTEQSLGALAGKISTLPGTKVQGAHSAVIAFNPSGASRTDAVSVLLESLPESGAFDLVDENGAALPYQTTGLGVSEMINMTLNRAELRSGLQMVAGGILAGMRIQDVSVRQEEHNAFIDAVVTENGAPNLPNWERARHEVEALLENHAVTAYHVAVRSSAAARVTFAAGDVPARGYRTFWVVGKPAEHKTPVQLSPLMRAAMPLLTKIAARPGVQKRLASLMPDPASKPPYRIENDFLRVEVNAQGTVDVLEKVGGAWFRGLNRFVDGGDCGDEYNYSPPLNDRLVTARLKSVRVVPGAVRQALEIRLELRVPQELSADRQSRSAEQQTLTLTSTVTLTTGVDRVDFHTTIDNHARDHRLRVHFPAPFGASSANYDGHFEIVRRAVGLPVFDSTWVEDPVEEVPQRAFTSITDGKLGMLLANRGLPEVAVTRLADGRAEIALTLLRCVGWLSRDDFSKRKGHAGPYLPTPSAQMAGQWTFAYAFVPHRAEDAAQAISQAYAFETPLRAAVGAVQSGLLPSAACFLAVEPGDFIISAVKRAEDRRGWIVRGYNSGDQPLDVRMRALLPLKTVERVKLSEERTAEMQVSADGIIRFAARPHEIVSLRVMFAPQADPS